MGDLSRTRKYLFSMPHALAISDGMADGGGVGGIGVHGREKPLAIDLFSGLGGWAEGLESEGWTVIRVDIEDMFAATGTPKPAECLLMIQDVLTVHGSQFKNARLIVSSSPCTKYSYMAMPWKLAKAMAATIRSDETGNGLRDLNALFGAQFRIQREASHAAGHHIPMVVENVRGAQPWVGRAVWNYGSYYLWGDVPLLMPQVVGGRKVPGFRFDGSGRSFQTAAVLEGRKNSGGSWFKIGSPGQTNVGQNPDGRLWSRDPVASCGSKSPKRKAASARIAKIPFALSSHIGWFYHPDRDAL